MPSLGTHSGWDRFGWLAAAMACLSRSGNWQDQQVVGKLAIKTFHVVTSGSMLPEVTTFRWRSFTGSFPYLEKYFDQISPAPLLSDLFFPSPFNL